MKVINIFSFLTLGFIASVFSQNSIELTFTAENNGQYVPLDSIFIENLTQEGDTTLYAPDTVLVLDYITDIGNEEVISKNSLSVSQNYPNPFNAKTEFNLYLTEKEEIKIFVRDVLGRELVHFENNLNYGIHSFLFYPGNEKCYLLTVIGKYTSKTIKMLNSNNNKTFGGKCKIVYNKYEDNVIGLKSLKAVNNFAFNIGNELQYIGYATTLDSIFGSDVKADEPQVNTDYEFEIIKGLRCPGMHTVTDIDGNTYNTVQMGGQCWMKENLKTTTYNNNTPIPNVTYGGAWQGLTTGAYIWYDNNISWKGPYGALYNWYATINGLCPAGWHVPTDYEWTVLIDYFIGGTYPGNELKSCRQVNSPQGGGCKTTEHPRWNESGQNGTDDHGFSGLPGGHRDNLGWSFDDIGSRGYWWSTTEEWNNTAWGRGLNTVYGTVFENHFYKEAGYSVRCIKD